MSANRVFSVVIIVTLYSSISPIPRYGIESGNECLSEGSNCTREDNCCGRLLCIHSSRPNIPAKCAKCGTKFAFCDVDDQCCNSRGDAEGIVYVCYPSSHQCGEGGREGERCGRGIRCVARLICDANDNEFGKCRSYKHFMKNRVQHYSNKKIITKSFTNGSTELEILGKQILNELIRRYSLLNDVPRLQSRQSFRNILTTLDEVLRHAVSNGSEVEITKFNDLNQFYGTSN